MMQQPHIATKTLIAVHEMITRDQGAAYRGHLGRVIPHIGDAYRDKEEGFRNHMGASGIGKDCARAIWYSHRWATKPKFEGRMIRLFNRGHLEEARFIAILLTIGAQVYQQDENGKQYRISYFGGHYGGSGDGVVVDVPDLQPGQPALGEFKTSSDKYFNKLAGKSWKAYHDKLVGIAPANAPAVAFDGEGVRVAKYDHWVQMQQYMNKMGLAVALYLCVNKDNDLIYAELVQLDSVSANKYVDRAWIILNSGSAPGMIAKPIGAYQCTFCDHKPVCKLAKPPEINCRTCAYSRPETEGPFAGKWVCDNKERQMKMLFGPSEGVSVEGEDFSLTMERQLSACKFYAKNQSM